MTLLGLMPPGLVLCKPRGRRGDWKHKTKTRGEAHVSVNQRAAFIHELRQGGALIWMNVATSVMSVYQLRVNTHRGPPAAESDEHSAPPHGPPFEFPSIPKHAQAFSNVRRKAGPSIPLARTMPATFSEAFPNYISNLPNSPHASQASPERQEDRTSLPKHRCCELTLDNLRHAQPLHDTT